MSIAVFGIGNILLSDDGAGVHAVHRLRDQYIVPASVDLIDGGTKGLDLLPLFEGREKVLIIDAAHFNRNPGTIDRVAGDEIPAFLSAKLSVHQIGLPDTLFAAKLLDVAPREMCLIGIQPASLETGTGLSEAVESRMASLLERVCEQLRQWGVEVVPRDRSDY